MISLGRDLIASMNGANYRVRRTATGSYDNTGVYQDGVQTVITVFASVQPLTGDDIERIPEGDRTKDMWKVYAADELRIHDEKTGAKADKITIMGDEYVVQDVRKWPGHWRATVVKVEEATVAGGT